MTKILKRSVAVILSILMILPMIPLQAKAAGNNLDVTISVTYGQTEARAMLDYINKFRAGEDVDGQKAEYWKIDNKTTEDLTGKLKPLIYDTELEKAAMLRAAEIAMSFSHTRPDGSDCFTAVPNTVSPAGENIAAGSSTAYRTFVQWREDDEDYNGQGHRRNMLSKATHIGIGHVVFNGRHYWVQELGYSSTPHTTGDPCNEAKDIPVSVNMDQLQSGSFSFDPQSYVLDKDQKADLPKVTLNLLLTETWPSRAFSVSYDTTWTSADPKIAKIENGQIVGVAKGSTSISASISGSTATATVEVVVPADYSKVKAAKAKIPSDLSIYTDATAKAVTDAVAAVVEGKKNNEQDTVDGWATAIENAVKALELKPADYSKVDAAKAKVPTDLSIYTAPTAKAVTDAVAAVVTGKKITEQASVDAMAKAIEDAVKALEFKPADYTKVDTAKSKVPSDLSIYTDATSKAVTDAVKAVVTGKKITEQAAVDAMAKAIEDAVKALELKPADYSKVDAAKGKVPKDLSIYTDATVKALNDALSAVDTSKKITQQAEVGAMAKAIEDAISKLELKSADYSKVESVKEQAAKLDKAIYTEASLKAVDDAIAAVVEGKKITEQAAVDAMAKAIEDAIAKAEKKPADYTAVENAKAEAAKIDKALYTEDSLKAVDDAIAAVIEGKKIDEQADVDAMAKAIDDAIKALKLIPPFQFVDVADPDTQWFYDIVYEAYNYQNASGTRLMSGYAPERFPDGIHFGPTDTLARGQFAVMLYRFEDEPETVFDKNAFPDVHAGDFFDVAATWASQNKIITGYNDGRFGPTDNITREQLATILYRYAKYKGFDTSAKGDMTQFTDADKISDYAKEAIEWANGAGIITGKENKADDTRYIDPNGSAVRAE